MTSEAKVGLLFFAVLLLVGATVAFLSDFGARLQSYSLIVRFADVKDLQPGGDVRLAGVRIGKVTGVALQPTLEFPDQPVAVELAIEHHILLYENDNFVIEQTALIGETFVSVQRPPLTREPAEPAKQLTGDKEIAGGGTAGFSALPDAAERVMREAELVLTNARAAYLSEYNAAQVKAILESLAATTARANQATAGVIELVEVLTRTGRATEPKIAAMLEQLTMAAGNIEKTTEMVRQMAETSPLPEQLTFSAANIRQATEDLRAMMTEIRELTTGEETKAMWEESLASIGSAAANIDQLTADVRKLTGDDQLQADIRQTAADLRDALASIKRITAHTEEVLTDPGFTEDIQASVHSVREASEVGVEVARKADATLTRVDRTMDKVSMVARQFQPTLTTGSLALEAAKDEGLRADFDLHLQYGLDPHDYWLLGVRDLGDAERFNFQRAIPLGGDGVGKAGLFGNKVGIGYDYRVSPRFLLEMQLWDPDELFFDARGVFKLGDTWSLTTGVADLFGRPDPLIGLRRSTIISDHTDETKGPEQTE